MQRSSKEVLRQQRNHMFQIPARPDMLLLIPVGGSSQAGQSPIPGLSLGISLPSNSPRCRRKSEARCWTDRIPFANRVECALSFLSPGSSGSRLGQGAVVLGGTAQGSVCGSAGTDGTTHGPGP